VKRILSSLFIVALSLGFVAQSVDARPLGGGRSQGMQRQMPPRQQPNTPPPQQQPSQQNASPAAAGAAAVPAAAPRRSWMGPIAGLAAGLGLAALMSHLGFGAEFANIMMIALLGIVGVMVVTWLLRRFSPAARQSQGLQFAGAGQPGAVPLRHDEPAWRSGAGAAPALAAVPQDGVRSLPAHFDQAAFERAAKMIFIRMQAANDASDLNDLRQFSTPEMFAAFRLDLQDRRGAAQQTDVVQLDAEVRDFAEEAGQQIVSVRYHGLLREEPGSPAAPFDEVWHLVKPADGSREWAIAGIQQAA
jgi:predicted lipid-binding transport protein (Tim44 family)